MYAEVELASGANMATYSITVTLLQAVVNVLQLEQARASVYIHF